MQETWVQSLGLEYPLEKEMATHSSILAWEIPQTEEPGELQSMGSQRVGHDWATKNHCFKTRPMRSISGDLHDLEAAYLFCFFSYQEQPPSVAFNFLTTESLHMLWSFPLPGMLFTLLFYLVSAQYFFLFVCLISFPIARKFHKSKPHPYCSPSCSPP